MEGNEITNNTNVIELQECQQVLKEIKVYFESECISCKEQYYNQDCADCEVQYFLDLINKVTIGKGNDN